MEALVKHLVQALVDQPDQVDVSIEENDTTVQVTVQVASEDMGKIIGKQGRIANALRTVLKAVGARMHKKVYVEIVE
ncbi:KH domain-containing protein [Peptococcus simiae]|uniref:KH domain-containing protein n=1 Tax=Peptococcus simiae TaxID=1643805 RepID=UPI0039808696